MNDIKLPRPWREVTEPDSPGLGDRLARIGVGIDPSIAEDALMEQFAGYGLTYGDLNDADVSRNANGVGALPASRRAYLVMGHQWIEVENEDTGARVRIRMQVNLPESSEWKVSAVVVPFDTENPVISASDMKALPLASIAAAFSERKAAASVMANRLDALGSPIVIDPYEHLPKADGSDGFFARVGIQYEVLDGDGDGRCTARRMASINGVSLPTAQRWLAGARKRGMLGPVKPGPRAKGGGRT